MYTTVGVIGLGGAVLGYSKSATMLAVFATMAVVEGVNYLVHRSEGKDA